jgi:hypothetical protein
VAADLDFDLPPIRRSKAPLVIAALVVVGGGIAAAVLLSGGGETPAVAAPIPDSPPVVTTPAATPTTAAPTTTAAPDTATSTPENEAPPAGGDFAEMFASGARVAGADGQVAARFEAAAAKKAVAKALTGVGRCKEPGGPRGTVTAEVGFESSGKVSSVTISEAPFAGTSTATCLSSVLKEATMPPFKGLPGTIKQPISIR